MSQINWLKIGGIATTIVGAGVSIASDMIGKKQIAEELVNSKEVKDLIDEAVNKALKLKQK